MRDGCFRTLALDATCRSRLCRRNWQVLPGILTSSTANDPPCSNFLSLVRGVTQNSLSAFSKSPAGLPQVTTILTPRAVPDSGLKPSARTLIGCVIAQGFAFQPGLPDSTRVPYRNRRRSNSSRSYGVFGQPSAPDSSSAAGTRRADVACPFVVWRDRRLFIETPADAMLSGSHNGSNKSDPSSASPTRSP